MYVLQAVEKLVALYMRQLVPEAIMVFLINVIERGEVQVPLAPQTKCITKVSHVSSSSGFLPPL
jgi:hypothetical protein